MDELEEFNKCYKQQQALIELGNLIWDNCWSWTVIKQEIDFAADKNGLFEVGVATFVNITVHPSRLERQNVGYSHLSHAEKGIAYNLSRKISVLNALKETMCSFGGEISERVDSALHSINSAIIKSIDTLSLSTKTENRENRNIQIKPSDLTKPKSPGKSTRFTPKPFTENSSAQNIVPANVNFSSSKPSNAQQPAPILPNSGPQLNQNARISNNAQFPPGPKASTSLTNFNPKPNMGHPKATLQQLPSNVITPITHDVSNVISSNIQGNCFNSKPLMKTIFLNQNTISYNNCHIQQDSHLFNNQVLAYQSPNKNAFVNNEWITPTIFHDGFWTENKVKLWANQNDLIHLTPTGDGSKC